MRVLGRLSQIGILVVGCFLSVDSMAYVGPSLGTGVIGIVIGFFFAILMALVALFYYPMKKLLVKLGVLAANQKSNRNLNDDS